MDSFSTRSFWPENKSPVRFLLTGAVMESLGAAVIYPVAFCRTHLQTNTSPLSASGNPFMHLAKQAQRTVSQHGVRGLYRGFVWSTVTSFPGLMGHVAVYTMAKHKLGYNELNASHDLFSHDPSANDTHALSIQTSSGVPQALVPLLSGLTAETVSLFALVPTEVVIQRVQIAPHGHTVWKVMKDVYREGGVRSFWRGTTAAYATYLPASGLWWGSYEFFKNQVCKQPEMQNLLGYSIAGILGGLTTAVLTNPIDVVRTRVQTQRGTYGSTKILDVMRNMYRKEGMLVFSKGIGARLTIWFLEGIYFADGYEIIMHFSHVD